MAPASVACITDLHELNGWSSHADQLGNPTLPKAGGKTYAGNKELTMRWQSAKRTSACTTLEGAVVDLDAQAIR